MTRQSCVAGRLVAEALGGRAGAGAAVPFLVLDLGRGCDPHQARCRRCRWRSGWRTTAAQAQVEHARHQAATHGRGQRPARHRRLGLVVLGAAAVRPLSPGWGSPPAPHLSPGRRPELGGVAVLVVVTVLAALAAPHARTLRGLVPGERPELPAIGRPARAPAASGDGTRAGRAVAFALDQRGKPYRWGAEGPAAFDCSGLTWAAWRAAGVTIPRTAAGQLAGLPRVRDRLRPGDLLIYRTDGPSRRHVAMVVDPGRMVEALGRGIPVHSTSIRPGYLGAVRPGAGR